MIYTKKSGDQKILTILVFKYQITLKKIVDSNLDNTKDNSKDLKHNQAHESDSNELDSAKRYLTENQKLRKHNHEQPLSLMSEKDK